MRPSLLARATHARQPARSSRPPRRSGPRRWLRSARPASLPGAASLPLLVCATAFGASSARAQQPAPAPAPDSAHAPRADSVLANPPAPPDSVRAAARDSTHVLPPAPADSLRAAARDSARGFPPAPADSARAAAPDSTHALPPAPAGIAPPDSAHRPAPDSTRARAPASPAPVARPDSTCVRPGPIPLSCLLRVGADSGSVRALFRGVGRTLLAHAAARTSARREPRTAGEYFASAFGPRALARSALTAGIEQLFGRPRRWPRNGRGYALRFGTRLGTEALAAGARYEMVSHLNEWMAPFEPCECHDAWGRLAHALAAPFRAQSPAGEHFSALTPLTELAGGMVLAGVASGGLRPAQGLTAGATGLLAISLGAVLQEFRPWERWLGK